MRVRPIVWINAALTLPASISLYVGIRNALLRSQDLQWSGAHLTLQHTDPYTQFLRHDPEHQILFTQMPNYLHELYILLLPLGALSFSHAKPVWALLNCLFAVLAVFFLRGIYKLQDAQTFLLLLLLFSSTPCRIVLGAGQQALFELLLFCLIFYFTKPAAQGIALGFSYSKYSFSPVLAFYLFFRRKFRLLAISLIAPLLGLFLMGLLVHRSPVSLSTEPLAVSRTGVATSLGLGDLMGIIHAFQDILPEPILGKFMYTMALLASGAYAFLLSRANSPSPRRDGAALAVASLMFFTHLTYDYVFLAVPLAAALATPFRWIKAYILTSTAILWFGIKLVPPIPPRVQLIEQLTVFLLLSGMLVLLSRNDLVPQSSTTESSVLDNLVEVV